MTPQRSHFAPNTSSTSTNQSDITSSSSTSTGNNRLDALEQLTELQKIVTLTKRLLEPPLPEPSIVEPSLAESPALTSAIHHHQTQYTRLPGIMKHAVYLAPSAWPPIRHA